MAASTGIIVAGLPREATCRAFRAGAGCVLQLCRPCRTSACIVGPLRQACHVPPTVSTLLTVRRAAVSTSGHDGPSPVPHAGVELILLALSRIEQGQADLTTKVGAMTAELVGMRADIVGMRADIVCMTAGIASTKACIAGMKTAVDGINRAID